MSKKGRGELASENGKVAASVMLDWLSHRGDSFPKPIWREQSSDSKVISEIRNDRAECVFVPVAGDGSLFHPSLNTRGSYELGSDEAPTYVTKCDSTSSCMETKMTRRIVEPRLSKWRRKHRKPLDYLSAYFQTAVG